MWVEVIGKRTQRKILINTDFVQSVYPYYEGDSIRGVAVDFGGHKDNYFVVDGSYNDIRDLISEGEWRK